MSGYGVDTGTGSTQRCTEIGFEAAKIARWPSLGLHHFGKFLEPSDEFLEPSDEFLEPSDKFLEIIFMPRVRMC